MCEGRIVNSAEYDACIPHMLLRHFGRDNTSVLSVFSGTGTDVVAAGMVGRDILTIDHDEFQVHLAFSCCFPVSVSSYL